MKTPQPLFHQKQTGSTLLEILVSVFVLSFGLLALVSMQLKTVMTAREAENQTIIAQASDSFIEGMLMNPVRSLEADDNIEILKWSFEEYEGLSESANINAQCVDDAVLSLTGNAGTDANGIDKEKVAKAHVCTFVKRLNQIPSTGNVTWRICQEDSEDVAKAVSFSGTGSSRDIACGGSGDHFVLKVVWEQELEDAQKYQDTDIVLNADDDDATAIVYTYQAPIGQ